MVKGQNQRHYLIFTPAHASAGFDFLPPEAGFATRRSRVGFQVGRGDKHLQHIPKLVMGQAIPGAAPVHDRRDAKPG